MFLSPFAKVVRGRYRAVNVQSDVWTPTTAIYEFMGIESVVIKLGAVDYVMSGYFRMNTSLIVLFAGATPK